MHMNSLGEAEFPGHECMFIHFKDTGLVIVEGPTIILGIYDIVVIESKVAACINDVNGDKYTNTGNGSQVARPLP